MQRSTDPTQYPQTGARPAQALHRRGRQPRHGAARTDSFSSRRASSSRDFASIGNGALRGVKRSLGLALCAGLLGLGLVPAAQAFAETCPNEAARTGPSANLPDCRAYEMVTPLEKQDRLQGSGDVATTPAFLGASADGQHVLFAANVPLPGSLTGQQDVREDTRTSAAWTSFSLEPAEALFAAPAQLAATHGLAVSPTFERVLLATTAALAPGDQHTEGAELYLRRGDGTFEWISQGSLGQASPGPNLFDATTNRGQVLSYGTSLDLRHVIFSWSSPLLPGAQAIQPGYTGLYERLDGATTIVDVNSEGQPIGTCGASLGGSGGEGRVLNDISDNGARVFFIAPGAPGCLESGSEVKPQLYVREDGRSTLEISLPEPGIVDPYGPQEAHFAGATPDGQVAYFTSHQELTALANTGPEDSSADLYSYDLSAHRLTDISATGDPAGARLDAKSGLGLVGFSEDGQLVYFVADGQIGGAGSEGHPNLYLSDHGHVRYIATLGESSYDQQIAVEAGTASVTPDGLHLLFDSTTDLTSYQSQGHSEVYEYEAPTAAIRCISCNPSGIPPRGNSFLPSSSAFRGLITDLAGNGSYAFFDSEEGLVAQDQNNAVDVYEYQGGTVHLISGGRGTYPSEFLGATPSGNDVYFGSYDSLVGPDSDGGQWDLYDARIGGGLPPSEVPRSCASAATCKATVGAPAFGQPATSSSAEASLPSPVASEPAAKPRPAARARARAQKLGQALKACRRRARNTRPTCERRARRLYAPAKASPRSAKSSAPARRGTR
jgi:hypothetical protein